VGSKLPSEAAPVDAGPHLRWYANLFRAERVQYILTTNAASLYSVVIYGRGITDDDLYLRQFLTELREQLDAADMGMIYKRCIAPHTGTVALAKAQDRSVLGSMNDMVFHCKSRLERGPISPWDLSEAINSTPYGALGYRFPREVFAQLRMGER
jgi:hypothetical protein